MHETFNILSCYTFKFYRILNIYFFKILRIYFLILGMKGIMNGVFKKSYAARREEKRYVISLDIVI